MILCDSSKGSQVDERTCPPRVRSTEKTGQTFEVDKDEGHGQLHLGSRLETKDGDKHTTQT